MPRSYKILPLLTWKTEAQRKRGVSARAILVTVVPTAYCNHGNKCGVFFTSFIITGTRRCSHAHNITQSLNEF